MLKNPFHTQLAIGILLQDEDTLEEKLNLLTELGLSTTKAETFKICEEFRERLCGGENKEVGADEIYGQRIWKHPRSGEQTEPIKTNGDE